MTILLMKSISINYKPKVRKKKIKALARLVPARAL
jgi:hypothetical protein